jgi:hypothetical protein
MALFVSQLDIGAVATVWHYLFFYGIWNFLRVWHYWFFIFILDFGTDSISIIWFSMGLWNYSHSVALSVYLLDFGTDQTVWHDCFFYGALE